MDDLGFVERRRHGRARIHMEAVLQGRNREEDVHLTVENFSVGGFFCRTSRHLEPLTRLGVVFQFPPYAEQGPKRLEAQALVVRCDKGPEEDEYRMAACFTELSPDAQKHIQGYVDWHDLVYSRMVGEERR